MNSTGDQPARSDLNEVRRRTRNIIALIRSIVSHSRDSALPSSELVDHLVGRIDAVGRIQSKLMRAASADADLEELVFDEIAAQADQHDLARVTISGPAVLLSARAAETLGLAFHELAVNAQKFGALSHRDATLDVAWAIKGSPDEPVLSLVWSEVGHRIISVAPRHRGFGHAYLEAAIPYELGGRADWTFGPGRVTCDFQIPLSAENWSTLAR